MRSCLNKLPCGFGGPHVASRGGHKELKKHVPNQKTPIAAAVVKHFQYIMEHSDNPFLCSIAAGQWMNMAGMCRDAHVHRSYLPKTCEHAYIFHCIEGKDASKPFNWTVPKATWGEGNGYKCSETMMSCLRTTHLEDESPWLLAQWTHAQLTPQRGCPGATDLCRATRCRKAGRQ